MGGGKEFNGGAGQQDGRGGEKVAPGEGKGQQPWGLVDPPPPERGRGPGHGEPYLRRRRCRLSFLRGKEKLLARSSLCAKRYVLRDKGNSSQIGGIYLCIVGGLHAWTQFQLCIRFVSSAHFSKQPNA